MAETLTISGAHNVEPNWEVIIAHFAVLVRIDINQFYDQIGIASGGAYPNVCFYRASKGEGVRQSFRVEVDDIFSGVCESLVFYHVVRVAITAVSAGVGNGIVRVRMIGSKRVLFSGNFVSELTEGMQIDGTAFGTDSRPLIEVVPTVFSDKEYSGF